MQTRMCWKLECVGLTCTEELVISGNDPSIIINKKIDNEMKLPF